MRDYVLSQAGAGEFLDRLRRAAAAGQRRLPAGGQALPDARRRLHRRQAPRVAIAEELASGSPATACSPGGAPGPGARVVRPTRGPRAWCAAGTSRAALRRTRGWSPSAAGTGCRLAGRAAPAHVAHHRGRHRRRRRRLVRPAAPRARRRAAGRPADGAGRAGRRRRVAAGPGPSCCSTASAATGALAGHPVGNLVLIGLAEMLGDPVAALDAAGRLLRRRGRVLPMAAEPLDIVADVVGLDEADPAPDAHDPRSGRGRHHPAGCVSVRLVPAAPAGLPGGGRRDRATADLVALGPGSWFTSVLPHLLVPDLLAALAADPGPAGGGAEPGRAAGGDRRILAGAAPGRTRGTRAGAAGRRGGGGRRRGGRPRVVSVGVSRARWRGWCWRRWPPATAPRGTTRSGWRPRYRRGAGGGTGRRRRRRPAIGTAGDGDRGPEWR